MRLPNFPLNNENDATAIALLLGGEAIAVQKIVISNVAVFGLDLFSLLNPANLERLTEKSGPLYASIQVVVPDADAPDDNARLIAFTEHQQWAFDDSGVLLEDLPPIVGGSLIEIANRNAWVTYVRENGRYLGHLSTYEVRSWANLKNFRFVPVSNTNYNIEVRITYYG